ncbi:MAG: RNA polymerase sigma factor [Candidatus Omnitrophica bacterium]|nr:RNA polymerase sigma factor [Candidatus Omnitrophota bacterium]
MKNNLNEKFLIVQAKKGDKEAFSQLIKQVEKRLFNVAYIINPEDAEDIVQDTFLQAYSSIKKFKGKSSFYTWIYRIMMNLIYKKYKRKKINFKKSIIKNENNKDEELKEKLRIALTKLHPKFSQIITLFYFEDYSIKEISEILNIKEGTVKSRIFKAKKYLKKFIEKNEPF